MKCLTLIQPFASLIVDGRKLIETRSWPTKHRGTIGLHAGAKVDKAACADFGYHLPEVPTGAILGVATIIDCVQFPSPIAPPDRYGDFTPGRFGWILDKIERFAKPIEAKGMLGLWDCPLLDKAKQRHLWE